VEAATWLAQHQLGTIDEAAFEQWRDRHPAHAIAFARALAAWEGAYPYSADETGTSVPMASRRALLRAAGGMCAVAVLGMAGFASRAYAWNSATTKLGESRKIRLSDGSIAALNTDSCLAWRFSARERTLWIERGEVAIDLCGGPHAMLHGDRGVARITPGRFNARLRGSTLDLLVLRGAATVDTRTSVGATTVGSYHSLMISEGGPVVRQTSAPQVDAAIAWQQGEILFQDATLGTAVEDYNRYLSRKIVIVDPELATIPVGGRFTSTDPRPFLRAVSTGLGIHVSMSETAYLLTR
jgi:transmembrane sensor